MFENRIEALRRKRKRVDDSKGRPFSRMHKYFKMLDGDGWAKSGTRFVPKDLSLFVRAPCDVPRSSMAR